MCGRLDLRIDPETILIGRTEEMPSLGTKGDTPSYGGVSPLIAGMTVVFLRRSGGGLNMTFTTYCLGSMVGEMTFGIWSRVTVCSSK